MEAPSDESEPESNKPSLPKPAAKPSVRLSKTVLVDQPTFDSDDDLVVPKKKQCVVAEKVRPAVRLAIASKSTIHGVLEAMESMDYVINIYPLNYAMRFTGNVNVVPCHAYRNGSPAENYDVQEKGGFEPGKAELDGFAVLAYEIAEDLVANKCHAAVIVSELGGDAVRLLAGCASQAIRKIASRETAATIIGSRAVQPSAKATELCKISKMFGASWTKITARAEISKFIA